MPHSRYLFHSYHCFSGAFRAAVFCIEVVMKKGIALLVLSCFLSPVLRARDSEVNVSPLYFGPNALPVPEMLDAISLGMRSGLSFESAMRLYGSRFDDRLALACRSACQSWESGLVERDEALRAIAEQFDVPSLSRFVANAQRALKYGSPMGRMLEVLSNEARSCYRAKMEERVAKAPVKMLTPTAGLILPAMLIMMMGPVVLELIG